MPDQAARARRQKTLDFARSLVEVSRAMATAKHHGRGLSFDDQCYARILASRLSLREIRQALKTENTEDV